MKRPELSLKPNATVLKMEVVFSLLLGECILLKGNWKDETVFPFTFRMKKRFFVIVFVYDKYRNLSL